MYTLICAGGSGQKVLESVLHLCAAGFGPDTLRILAVDPDYANGNLERVQKLVEEYIRCQTAFRGKLGNVRWFKTSLEVLSRDEKGALRVWSPVGIQDRLRDLINFDVLANTPTPPDLASLFFTRDQMDMPLGGGFRGQPNIGAAAFGLTHLHKDKEPWSLLIENMRGELDQPTGSKVFLAGSIFGGTGASAMHPLARFLKSQFDKNKDNLQIGVCALVPYFRFAVTTAKGDKGGAAVTTGPMARSDNFAISTQSALEFYEYLRSNDDWPFDYVSVVGDAGMMDVEFSMFGATQRNSAHFVEIMAATSALDFFASERDPKSRKQVRFAGPRANVETREKGVNPVDWLDLPPSDKSIDEIRQGLLEFWVAGTAHLGFYDEVVRHRLLDVKPECVPWYYERFHKKNATLQSEPARADLNLITSYFSEHFFPWWRAILGAQSADVRLFNATSLKDTGGDGNTPRGIAPGIDDLANLDWPNENDKRSFDLIDSYFGDSAVIDENSGGSTGAASYFSILGLAARAFVSREYKRVKDSSKGNQA